MRYRFNSLLKAGFGLLMADRPFCRLASHVRSGAASMKFGKQIEEQLASESWAAVSSQGLALNCRICLLGMVCCLRLHG